MTGDHTVKHSKEQLVMCNRKCGLENVANVWEVRMKEGAGYTVGELYNVTR